MCTVIHKLFTTSTLRRELECKFSAKLEKSNTKFVKACVCIIQKLASFSLQIPDIV